MIINYKSNLSPSVTDTVLTESSIKDSQFFIYKEDGFIDFIVEANEELEHLSEIYSERTTNKKQIVVANTDRIIATNIVVDGVPYFYKVTYIGGEVDALDIILNSSVDCVLLNGTIYTNQAFVNLEISPNIFIYSSPIVTNKKAKVTYKVKEIELEFNNDLGKLYFKPQFMSVLQSSFVNPNKISFDSFYIKKNNTLFKCIEGDVRYFEKTEYINQIGNSLQCKDIVHKYDSYLYNEMYNKIYFDKFFFTRTERNIINYTAKTSSHVFNVKDVLYCLITKQGLVKGSKDNYDFKVTKTLDSSKISINLSDSLNIPLNTLKPNEYVISNSVLTDNSKIGLKEVIKTSLRKFPSEKYYISQDNVIILQHTNSVLDGTQIPIRELEDIEEIEYTKNEDIYTDYAGCQIDKTTYYRVKGKYGQLLSNERGIQLYTEKLERIITG